MAKLFKFICLVVLFAIPNISNAITFTFEGRETQFCNNEHAILRATYNGVSQDFITSTTYQTFTATFPDSAASTVSFRFVNDYYNPGVCDRNIEMRNFNIGCQNVALTDATITGCRWNSVRNSAIFMACPGDAIFNIPDCGADLSITKSVNISTPSEKQDISYTITVTNNGPSAVTGFTLTDNIPSGVTYLNSNATSGTVTP